MGSPFSGGIRHPAPRRQCWTMVRLCSTSSLKNTKQTECSQWKSESELWREYSWFLFFTCSYPVLPVQISEGAEVQAGGSRPVNKKQRRSLQHWVHATGCPNSTDPQADPSPAWDEKITVLKFGKNIRNTHPIFGLTFICKTICRNLPNWIYSSLPLQRREEF